MPISFIHEGFGDKFYEILENTNKEVLIISPFISYLTADRFSRWLEESAEDIKCVIITRFNREEFIRGASSIEGLERLKQAGANIFALQHLHSKLYIFDDHSAIMGSANFTLKGFFRNHELGILIENESIFTGQCIQYFSMLAQQIQDSGNWELDIDKIEKEKQLVTHLLSKRGHSSSDEYNTYRWGAVLDKEENAKQSRNPTQDIERHFDIIEKAVSKKDNNEENINTGIWIKFEGTSENRIPNDAVYLKRRESFYDYLDRTYYPRQPISVKKGDIIFLAVLSKDKDGNETPIIVGYAFAEGFCKDNIIDNNDKKYKEWNNRYPYYIEFTNGKFLNKPVSEGVTLLELCNALGHRVYPKTKDNDKIPVTKILKRHYQKAHIQITEDAKKYLVARLDTIFNQFGYDSV